MKYLKPTYCHREKFGCLSLLETALKWTTSYSLFVVEGWGGATWKKWQAEDDLVTATIKLMKHSPVSLSSHSPKTTTSLLGFYQIN